MKKCSTHSWQRQCPGAGKTVRCISKPSTLFRNNFRSAGIRRSSSKDSPPRLGSMSPFCGSSAIQRRGTRDRTNADSSTCWNPSITVSDIQLRKRLAHLKQRGLSKSTRVGAARPSTPAGLRYLAKRDPGSAGAMSGGSAAAEAAGQPITSPACPSEQSRQSLFRYGRHADRASLCLSEKYNYLSLIC